MRTKILSTVILSIFLVLSSGVAQADNEITEQTVINPVYINFGGSIGTGTLTVPTSNGKPITPTITTYMSYSISGQNITFTVDRAGWVADGSPATLRGSVFTSGDPYPFTYVFN